MDEKAIDIAKKTLGLASKIADYSSIYRINSIQNIGKRIEMCASATILLDTIDAYKEYMRCLEADLKTTKISRSFLTRYIFESYVNFIYIFKAKKSDRQVRSKAFYHFGDYKKNRMQRFERTFTGKDEWNKYIFKKGNPNQWHGESFQAIAKAANYSPVIYEVLSQFTHPGIYTLERTCYSDMFTGIMEDSHIFTSGAMCDMMQDAANLNLYGIKLSPSIRRDIDSLIQIHNQYFIDHMQKKNKDAS